MEELNSTGSLKLDSISDEVVLSKEDLLIEMTQMEGYVTQSDNNITVVLALTSLLSLSRKVL